MANRRRISYLGAGPRWRVACAAAAAPDVTLQRTAGRTDCCLLQSHCCSLHYRCYCPHRYCSSTATNYNMSLSLLLNLYCNKYYHVTSSWTVSLLKSISNSFSLYPSNKSLTFFATYVLGSVIMSILQVKQSFHFSGSLSFFHGIRRCMRYVNVTN